MREIYYTLKDDEQYDFLARVCLYAILNGKIKLLTADFIHIKSEDNLTDKIFDELNDESITRCLNIERDDFAYHISSDYLKDKFILILL